MTQRVGKDKVEVETKQRQALSALGLKPESLCQHPFVLFHSLLSTSCSLGQLSGPAISYCRRTLCDIIQVGQASEQNGETLNSSKQCL